MPDDILDAAQKQINQASQQAVPPDQSGPPGPPPPPPPEPPPSLPTPPASPPKADNPTLHQPKTTSPPTDQPAEALMKVEVKPETEKVPAEPPPEAPAPLDEKATQLVNDILQTPPTTVVVPTSVSPVLEVTATVAAQPIPETSSEAPPKKTKKRIKGPVLATLAFFLIAIPLGVYFFSQRQQLAEIRSEASVYCQQSCGKEKTVAKRRTCQQACEKKLRGTSAPVAPAAPPAGTGGGTDGTGGSGGSTGCAKRGQKLASGQKCCAGLFVISGNICGITGTRCSDGTVAKDKNICNCPSASRPAACNSIVQPTPNLINPYFRECTQSGKAPSASKPCCAKLTKNSSGVCVLLGTRCADGKVAKDRNMCNCADPPPECARVATEEPESPAGDNKCGDITCPKGILCADGKCLYADSSACTGYQKDQTLPWAGGTIVREPGGACTTRVECKVVNSLGTQHTILSTEETCGGGGNGGGGGFRCLKIKLYRDGVSVEPEVLKPGDQVVIAVKDEGATKAQVRVNGAGWIETTTQNSSSEFTVDFSIPTDGPISFTIEAEVFKNGEWK